MGMTFAEKILAKKAGLAKAVPGQIVEISVTGSQRLRG